MFPSELQTVVDTPTTLNEQRRADEVISSTSPYIPELPTANEVKEAIAKLAYAHWEARGRPEGSSEEDWFLAEKELQLMRLAVKADG